MQPRVTVGDAPCKARASITTVIHGPSGVDGHYRSRPLTLVAIVLLLIVSSSSLDLFVQRVVLVPQGSGTPRDASLKGGCCTQVVLGRRKMIEAMQQTWMKSAKVVAPRECHRRRAEVSEEGFNDDGGLATNNAGRRHRRVTDT
ncbi:hypothetical protein CPC08DRAFT_422753 [Agrocybe pediades]|nr:hypothetical protein CPC08DRAFT_422753 [Agrocybe pediades]